MYEELVKKLRRCGNGLCTEDCPDWTKENLYHTCQDEVVLEAADAIEELSKPRWIPVTERLPEEKKAVLVWCPKYLNQYECYLVCDAFGKREWIVFGSFGIHLNLQPTHWRPLPEPPKEEQR